MEFAQEPIFQWLSQYAYNPTLVYLSVVGFMLASSVGMPIPEEVTIISVGLLAYMGANPQLFPPPEAGLPVVNGYEAAFITLMAVFCSDLLVFSVGRTFGRQIVTHRKLNRVFTEKNNERIARFVNKYGVYATFIFRFTPGLRFPAHIFLGMSPIPTWQFAAVDFFAAFISVPTQIILIFHYGEPILNALSRFKSVLLALIAIAIVFYFVKRVVGSFQAKMKPN